MGVRNAQSIQVAQSYGIYSISLGTCTDSRNGTGKVFTWCQCPSHWYWNFSVWMRSL